MVVLKSPERAVLSRASAFAGEFSLEAAEKVCAAQGVDELDVTDIPDSLVRKSLMATARSESAVRYSLLETIRQFGEEQLVAMGESQSARARHAQFFADESGRMFKIWRSPREREAYEWLDLEIANLRAAFHWAKDNGEVELAARIASNIGDMGRMRLRDEAANWSSEIVDAAREIAHPRLIVLLTWAASSAWAFQRRDEAKACAEEAIALVDDPRFDPFVWAYADLAMIAAFQGEPAKALALLRKGAAHAADRVDRFCHALLHYSQGPLLQGEEASNAVAEANAAAKATQFPSAVSILTAGTGRALKEKIPRPR
jgi:hypothetical protein